MRVEETPVGLVRGEWTVRAPGILLPRKASELVALRIFPPDGILIKLGFGPVSGFFIISLELPLEFVFMGNLGILLQFVLLAGLLLLLLQLLLLLILL